MTPGTAQEGTLRIPRHLDATGLRRRSRAMCLRRTTGTVTPEARSTPNPRGEYLFARRETLQFRQHSAAIILPDAVFRM